MAEAGVLGVKVDLWSGLLGPARLPAPPAARLNGAVHARGARPATQDQLRSQGMQPVGGLGAAFAVTIAADLARRAGVTRAAGISAD